MPYWITETELPNGELFVRYPKQIQSKDVERRIRKDAERVAPELASIHDDDDLKYWISAQLIKMCNQLNQNGYVIVVERTPDGDYRKFIIADDQIKSNYYATKIKKHYAADCADQNDQTKKRQLSKDAKDALKSINHA